MFNPLNFVCCLDSGFLFIMVIVYLVLETAWLVIVEVPTLIYYSFPFDGVVALRILGNQKVVVLVQAVKLLKTCCLMSLLLVLMESVFQDLAYALSCLFYLGFRGELGVLVTEVDKDIAVLLWMVWHLRHTAWLGGTTYRLLSLLNQVEGTISLLISVNFCKSSFVRALVASVLFVIVDVLEVLTGVSL